MTTGLARLPSMKTLKKFLPSWSSSLTARLAPLKFPSMLVPGHDSMGRARSAKSMRPVYCNCASSGWTATPANACPANNNAAKPALNFINHLLQLIGTEVLFREVHDARDRTILMGLFDRAIDFSQRDVSIARHRATRRERHDRQGRIELERRWAQALAIIKHTLGDQDVVHPPARELFKIDFHVGRVVAHKILAQHLLHFRMRVAEDGADGLTADILDRTRSRDTGIGHQHFLGGEYGLAPEVVARQPLRRITAQDVRLASLQGACNALAWQDDKAHVSAQLARQRFAQVFVYARDQAAGREARHRHVRGTIHEHDQFRGWHGQRRQQAANQADQAVGAHVRMVLSFYGCLT